MVVTDAGVSESSRSGFFNLEASGKNTVNVEGFGVGVKLDDDVINRIKYIKSHPVLSGPIFKTNKKGKQLLDKKGNCIRMERVETIRPAKWIGYSNQKKIMVPLSFEWLEQNFDKRFLGQIRNMSASKTAFVHVPPGDNRDHTSNTLTQDFVYSPKVHYQQAPGARTCMVDAMTSGLHHIGARQAASEIWQMRKRFQFKPGAYTIRGSLYPR